MKRTRRLDLRARARRLSVKTLIGAVALVPLMAIGWLAASASSAVARDRQVATEAQRRVREVGALIQIRWKAFNEWTFTEGAAETERLGLSPDEASELLDLDLVEGAARARGELDALLAAGDHTSITRATERARKAYENKTKPDEAENAIESLFAAIEQELDQANSQLTATAVRIGSGGQVVQASDALATAAELHALVIVLQQLLLDRTTAANTDTDFDVAAAYVMSRWDAGVARLRRLAPSDSPTAGALTTAKTAWEELLALGTTAASPPVPVDDAGLSDEQLARLADAAAKAFRAGAAAAEQHYAVVTAALESVDAEAARLDDEVRSSQVFTLSVLGALLLLTLAAFGLAARAIVRPLRRLAAAAASLRDGDLDVEVDLGGPSEIAATAAALDEAAAGLRLSEAQAGALATGALDDPVLSMPAPGRLGESLRSAVVALARSLNEREDYRLRLSHEASHDALTGLVNRAAAHDHLGGALGRSRRSRTALAVVFVDLDGFKNVNETHGHDVGDEVLRRVAEVLVATVRPDDLVGRFGSDEFVVVAEDVGTIDDAEALARRLVASLATPVEASGRMHHLTASAGVRVCTADDPVQRLSSAGAVVELLRDVDAALERAKTPGCGPVEVFTPDLQRELRERLEIEQALRVALEPGRDELHLVYQPVVDADTCAPVGAEALVRWNRPGVGPVRPDVFVPVAERSELIIELDDWVLRTATRQLAVWAAAGVLGQRWVAVNLSGAHVCRPEVVPRVLGALADAGVAPRHLIVELTERELLADVEVAASNLRALRDAGVRIAIDDFGTGFTSLAHLRWLPIDKLKIDKSFVTNLSSSSNESLVRLVIETGHVLGVEVTAEGVETVEELEALRTLGADHVQGYLTGRPEAAAPRPVLPSP